MDGVLKSCIKNEHMVMHDLNWPRGLYGDTVTCAVPRKCSVRAQPDTGASAADSTGSDDCRVGWGGEAVRPEEALDSDPKVSPNSLRIYLVTSSSGQSNRLTKSGK